MLRATAAACWTRSGVHEDDGTLSLSVIVRGLVAHEEEHCAQLEAIRPFTFTPPVRRAE